MKPIQYFREVVFFRPSQKEYDSLPNEDEKINYRIRILRKKLFIANLSIAISMAAIVLSALTLIIRLLR